MKKALALLALVHLAVSTSVNLNQNGYEGLVIAINPSVPEDPTLIENLKSMWTAASSVLFEATYNRAYFRDITILVPTNWTAGTYEQADSENYDDADVKVAEANPQYGDVPYTLQLEGCGKMGEHIHLTPEFIRSDTFETNYGPKEKTLVKGWAHYRWGVFDEAATGANDRYYWDSNEELQATRCSLSLAGVNVNSKTGDACAFDQATGLPEDDCVFVVNEEQEEGVTSSLMSHQFVKQVIHFSSDDDHNREAPSEQNRLCNQMSAWAVIKYSEDFNQDSLNPPRDLSASDLVPTFHVVRHQTTDKRFVMVLDSSGSMSGEKFTAMKSSTISFIESPDSSSIGLVDFDSGAWTLAEITKKDSDASVQYLVDQMSDSSFQAGGGTDIDGGIWKGLEVFGNHQEGSSGGIMVVLTDGQGTIGGSTDDCLAARVTVHTIFLGVSVGNDELQNLCDVTGGKWCIVNDVTDNAALKECFNKFLSESQNDGDTSKKLHQIHSTKLSTTSAVTASGVVPLDSTVGSQTVFTFTWAYSSVNPEIYLYDPQNLMYCSSQTMSSSCGPSIVGSSTDYNTITFNVPGLASVGEWTYDIQTSSSDTVSVTVTSYSASPSLEPIDVQSGLSVNQVSDLTPVSVFAQVKQGLNPILGATVIATVTDPYGTKTDLSLKDSGAGADIRKNDGIYTRFYTGFQAPGRYSVQVTVSGKGNSTDENETSDSNTSSGHGFSSAAFIYGKVEADGTVVLNENSPPVTETAGGVSSGDLESFERIASPQGLEYTGPAVDPTVDSYPPSQVLDLKATQKNISDITQGFVVTFSAPGNNYDEGKAAGYEIRYTTSNDTSILRTSFDSQLSVSSDDFIVGDLSSPTVSGEDEYFVISLKDIEFTENTVRIGVAMRAFDESGNYGAVSNVVVMSAYKTSPLFWGGPILHEDCMDEEMRYISRGPFPVEDDCTSFYKCSNGYRSLHNCPSDLLFNPAISVCDWPENVECGKTEEIKQEVVKEACKDENGNGLTGGPYKVEDDCSVFYMCSAGYKTTQNCVPGLVFNEAISACDWPANVPGC